MKGIRAVLLLAVLLSSLCVQAQAGLLERANELISQGQAKSALELLLPDGASFAADARYHYLLGTAYFDVGDPENAITAFRDALSINPQLLQAEAELGRAYLLTGNYLAAQFAFDNVKRGNPPPEVSAAIDSYVEKLHNSLQSQRPRFRGSVSIGIGHDSNVNSATSAQRVLLPILGGITATLDSAARERSDNFISAGIEASGFTPLDDQTELFLGGGTQLKANNKIDEFDFLTGNASGGVRYAYGSHQESQISLSVSADSIHQDNIRVRDSYGLNLEYRYIFHPLAEASAFAQQSKLEYPREPFRDADRKVYGFALNPVAFGKRLFNLPPVASVYWGSERPTASGVDHLGYRLTGVRTAAFAQFNSRFALFAGLGYERRAYGDPDPLFAETRVDRQTDFNAGFIYAMDYGWSFTPVISYTDTQSTLDVFKYDRMAVTATLRYQF